MGSEDKTVRMLYDDKICAMHPKYMFLIVSQKDANHIALLYLYPDKTLLETGFLNVFFPPKNKSLLKLIVKGSLGQAQWWYNIYSILKDAIKTA